MTNWDFRDVLVRVLLVFCGVVAALLLFKGGRVVDTIIGAVPKSKLVDSVSKFV